jgi:formylglycine-generating enzyme required for sulfatase activity
MTHRVQRGGTWFFRTKQQAYLRWAYRRVDQAHYRDDLVGFRVVCLPPEIAPPRMVLRGGCSHYGSWFFRSTYRGFYWPDNANRRAGFRVVCLPPGVPPPRMVPPLRVVARGGDWSDFRRWPDIGLCNRRSAWRDHTRPGFAGPSLGFRVICLPRGMTP